MKLDDNEKEFVAAYNSSVNNFSIWLLKGRDNAKGRAISFVFDMINWFVSVYRDIPECSYNRKKFRAMYDFTIRQSSFWSNTIAKISSALYEVDTELLEEIVLTPKYPHNAVINDCVFFIRNQSKLGIQDKVIFKYLKIIDMIIINNNYKIDFANSCFRQYLVLYNPHIKTLKCYNGIVYNLRKIEKAGGF